MSLPGTGQGCASAEFISTGPCPLRPALFLLRQGREAGQGAEMMTTRPLRLPGPCLLSGH